MESFKNLALAAVLVVPGISAADGKITFQGEVTNQTCKVTVNDTGEGITTVNLPKVGANQLAAAGDTAGRVPFKLKVAECTPGNAALSVHIHVKDAPIENGRLKNMAPSGASNVQLQLLKGMSGGEYALSHGYHKIPELTVPAMQNGSEHEFAVQYYATGPATAGQVVSHIEYGFSYK